MTFDIEDKLKEIMPKKLTHNERRLMWNNIESELNTAGNNGLKGFFQSFQLRYVVVPVLVLMFVTGSAGTLAMANNAKPGDFLFPLDVATENVLVALSYGSKKDELILRFSNERLEEAEIVLDLVALQAEAFSEKNKPRMVAMESAKSNVVAETDDNNEDESSPAAFMAVSTTTEEETEDNDNQSNVATVGSIGVESADLALEVALEHLLKNRESFVEKGNDIAVKAIDEIIEKLQKLAEDYVESLNSVQVAVKENNNKVSIEVKTSANKIKTTFKLTENKNKDDGDGSSVVVKANGKSSSIKVKDGNSTITYKDSEIKKKKEYDEEWWEDWWEDKNKKITICYKGKTFSILESAWPSYKKNGAYKGKCKESKKKIYICYKDRDKKIYEYKWPHYENKGATKGKCEDDSDTTPPNISDVSLTVGIDSAGVYWETNERTTGDVWYSINSPLSGTSVIDLDLDDDHAVTLTGLSASTTYNFIIVARDEYGNTSTTSESNFTTLSLPEPIDEEPPTISNINTDVATTSAVISWDTNEEAGPGTVWYGTDSSTLTLKSTSLDEAYTYSHAVAVGSLSDNTTYYYVVVSKDSSGNTATSSELSFTTLEELPPPDETPPVISSLTAINILANSADLEWNTDESSKSSVWYSTSTPVSISPETSNMTDNNYSLSHSFNLSGLSASTTYYYLVNSVDEAGNSASSSEQGFTTQ